MKKLCDLHTHSNFSDGSFSPTALVALAKEQGMSAVALCDHNTVRGLPEFLSAAKENGIIGVPGIEVTCEYGGREVHIVGLFVPETAYEPLSDYLEEVNRNKIISNNLLAINLSVAGYGTDINAVKALAGDAIPNRAHFAEYLMKKGYVSSTDEAFDTLLAEERGLYVPSKKLAALEVIAFMRSLSVMPIIAHPLVEMDVQRLDGFLTEAKRSGLVGLECIYPLFSPEQAESAFSLAEKHSLAPSGGSDFHGTRKADIRLGFGRGNIEVPFEIYDNLSKIKN